MKRAVKITLLALVALVAVVVLSVDALLGTEAGSRWALNQVPGLSVENFQGRLAGQWSADHLLWQQGGDRVELHDGHLSINGQPLADASQGEVEDFGQHLAQLDLGQGGGPDITGLTVPDGKVLMLGDHRGNSADGRFFGLVQASALYGKASHVYYRRGDGLTWQAL